MCIFYAELQGDISKNPQAFEKIISTIADTDIGYFSLNHPLDRDPVCGYVGVIDDVCPRCGRRENEPIPPKNLNKLLSYADTPEYLRKEASDEEREAIVPNTLS